MSLRLLVSSSRFLALFARASYRGHMTEVSRVGLPCRDRQLQGGGDPVSRGPVHRERAVFMLELRTQRTHEPEVISTGAVYKFGGS